MSFVVGFGWTPSYSMILTRGLTSIPQSTNTFSFGMAFPSFYSIPTSLPPASTYTTALGSGPSMPLHSYPYFSGICSMPNTTPTFGIIIGSILP